MVGSDEDEDGEYEINTESDVTEDHALDQDAESEKFVI
jgi:hypothetical protein